MASWRTIFAILAGMGLLNLLLVKFVLPVGYRPDTSVRLRLGPIFDNFRSILQVRQFATYTFAGSFSFAGLFVYIAGSPAIFMDGFHVSAKVYGLIFASLAVAMIGGGQINLLLIKKWREQTVIKISATAQTVFGFIFLAGSYFETFGLIETVVILFFILLCAGINYPNAAALALQPFSKNVGSASSLLGFLQLGTGSLTSAGVGLLEAKGSLPTALVICISSLIAFTILTVAKSEPEAT
jgi:DHA1 family bicyclomycin/chloramphenicol resistance-like MFS transporter